MVSNVERLLPLLDGREDGSAERLRVVAQRVGTAQLRHDHLPSITEWMEEISVPDTESEGRASTRKGMSSSSVSFIAMDELFQVNPGGQSGRRPAAEAA